MSVGEGGNLGQGTDSEGTASRKRDEGSVFEKWLRMKSMAMVCEGARP